MRQVVWEYEYASGSMPNDMRADGPHIAWWDNRTGDTGDG